MKNERILVANLKCNGCATTVRRELMKLEGVTEVHVALEEDAVDVSYDQTERASIVHRLLALGYPEATEKNGLLLQLKSYGSCMLGRAHNMV